MEAELIQLNDGLLEPDPLQRVVEALLDGHLVILPTETVYGLVADERHPRALERIAALKGRPQDQPISRLAASIRQIEAHGGQLSPRAKRLAEKFWPGPLTMICPHQQGDTVGYRIPDHPVALAVLDAVGAPLLGTSVNRHGQPEALDGRAAMDEFGQEVAVVIEAGPARFGQASTVVRIDPNLEILRPGELSLEALQSVTDHE